MEESDITLKGKNKKLKIKTVEEAPNEEDNVTREEYEKIDCAKCGAKKVISWIEQTRASDEPPTRFYKCLKCGHTWRDYT